MCYLHKTYSSSIGYHFAIRSWVASFFANVSIEAEPCHHGKSNSCDIIRLMILLYRMLCKRDFIPKDKDYP